MARGEGSTARGTSIKNQQQLSHYIYRLFLGIISAEAPSAILPYCEFPRAVITKYHKLDGLKQEKSIPS